MVMYARLDGEVGAGGRARGPDLVSHATPAPPTGAVTVRRYHRRDRNAVAAMSEALSPHTLYQRFFTGYPRLPSAFLDRLDGGLDGPDAVLLAVQGAVVLGVGELILTGTPPVHAEVSLLVRDTHQRQGIGLRLVDGLVEHAHRFGIPTLSADALTENRAVRSFIRSRYPEASASLSGTVTRYELGLDPFV